MTKVNTMTLLSILAIINTFAALKLKGKVEKKIEAIRRDPNYTINPDNRLGEAEEKIKEIRDKSYDTKDLGNPLVELGKKIGEIRNNSKDTENMGNRLNEVKKKIKEIKNINKKRISSDYTEHLIDPLAGLESKIEKIMNNPKYTKYLGNRLRKLRI